MFTRLCDTAAVLWVTGRIEVFQWRNGKGVVPSSCDHLGSHDKGLACASWHLCRVILLSVMDVSAVGASTPASESSFPLVYYSVVWTRFHCVSNYRWSLWSTSACIHDQMLPLVYHELNFIWFFQVGVPKYKRTYCCIGFHFVLQLLLLETIWFNRKKVC